MPGKLFLVVADCANLVTGLRVEGGLLERLVCARARPPIGGHLYRSLRVILHDCSTERSTVLAFNVSQLFALKRVYTTGQSVTDGMKAMYVEGGVMLLKPYTAHWPKR